MESFAKFHCPHSPLHLSLNPHRPSFTKPFPSLSFKSPPLPPSKFSSVTASSSPPPTFCRPRYRTPKLFSLETLNPILRTTCITLTAAAAIFLARVRHFPAIAAPVSSPALADPSNESVSTENNNNNNVSFEEQERVLEEHLSQNPDDVEALRSLMEVRIKSRKLMEAIEAVNRLIELEPNDEEWPLLKAQIYSYSGDFESAKKIFEEVLERDPLRVEAYHGLVMANSEAGDPFNDILKRIELAMQKCKKANKKSDLRDFKLLIAQVRVMEEKYGDALKVYEELVKEEPRDFRPYLCQGIIYTLLRRKDEAEKKFEQFRKLVPKNHPYREYFLDNMFASKFFQEKVDRSGTRS